MDQPIIFEEPARLPYGFRCAARNCGLKREGPDLTVFFSDVDAAAAAVFTRNQFPGAPVIVGRERIRRGQLRALVINSKISNVGNGETGIRNALRMATAAARALGVHDDDVLMSSTGVIGLPLPIEKIENGLEGIAAELQGDPLVAARGIMTTDRVPKALSCRVGAATITIVAKGAGMIEPNMATMLAYIFTDAALDATQLQRMLPDAVADSFNMLSIDTDTSTSDTCVLMANGLAGATDSHSFFRALHAATIRMAEMLARDGEGASKLLRVHVHNAASRAEARQISKTVVNSPLIKTMAYGADPNFGRILMAVGKCFDCQIAPERLYAEINGIPVIRHGARAGFLDDELRNRLAGDPVDITIDLGIGDAYATAFGCDLTEGYITENAAYYSS